MKIKSNTVQNRDIRLTSFPMSILEWIEENNKESIIFISNNIGEVLYVSESVYSLLGYHKNEILGKEWLNIFPKYDINFIYQFLNDSSLKKHMSTYTLKDKSGKKMYFESLVEKIKDGKSETELCIIKLNNITKIRVAEQFLTKSEKMSVAGQLAAGIAHEIRNPLTSIKGFLQLLQAGVTRKDEYYKIMIDEVEKLEMITSELLYISKPLTQHPTIESVQEMINDVTILLRSQAKLKNIEFELNISNTYHVYCDKSQIKQVLINLIKNAIESFESGGKIKIKTTENNGNVYIDIVDEGKGISEEIIHKIGQPFFTTKKNGTGLGLLISKQLLERHNGDLIIKKNKDAGSTFTIVLPKS